MRWAWVVAVAAICSSTALSAPRPPGFPPAEQYFNRLDLRDRITSQVMLIAAGVQNAVPVDRFQPAIFEATENFQASVGLPATGLLDRGTIDRLADNTSSLFRQWNFDALAHPWRGHPIWMPQGMGLAPIPNKYGLTFRDPDERVEVHYNFFPGAYIDKSYVDTLADLRRKGIQVHYAVQKDDWYVISSSSPVGIDAYRRYHIDGTGILGFTLFWNNARGNMNGERIAVLMSASLKAAMSGSPFVEPPRFAREAPAPAAPSPPTYPASPSNRLDTIEKGAKLRPEGVPDNDVIKIREEPNGQSRVLGMIPPDGYDIEFLGDRDRDWVFVRYEQTEGWVEKRFVAYEPRRGRVIQNRE